MSLTQVTRKDLQSMEELHKKEQYQNRLQKITKEIYDHVLIQARTVDAGKHYYMYLIPSQMDETFINDILTILKDAFPDCIVKQCQVVSILITENGKSKHVYEIVQLTNKLVDGKQKMLSPLRDAIVIDWS